MIETQSHYSIQIEVKANQDEVFKALTEGLGFWWGEISNVDLCLNGQFTVTFENGYWWTFRIMAYHPNQELIWKCIAGEPEFNKEWIGHVLHWKISKQDSKTLIYFHQIGLTSQLHCYEVCSSTWNMFLNEKLISYLE